MSKRRGKGPRAPSAAQRPLIEALLEEREDRALWSVLGDLMQTEGDPRGALVSLMLEREARPSPALLDAERRYRARHLAQLAPALDEDAAAMAWWRGFPSRLRATSSETLARAVRDPALRFLDAVALELETAEWADWLELLEGRAPPWRRVRIELTSDDDPIELAPLLEALPALEVLRIAFPEGGAGQLELAGARGGRLRLLAIRDAEHVDAEDVELPALTELRLLGAAEAGEGLRASALWKQLRRVVIDVGPDGEPPEADEEEGAAAARAAGPIIHHAAVAEREYLTTAFMVVAARIEPALLGELAAKLSGLEHLEATVATSPWHSVPLTAIRLRGAGATQLLPYGLGRAIEQRLSPPPAIALFSCVDGPESAEAAILGPQPSHRLGGHGGDALVRDVLDAAFGYDPGPDAFELLVEELDCAEPRMLIGTAGRHLALLVEIDPSAIPVRPEPDEMFDDPPVWHERDLHTDRFIDEPAQADESFLAVTAEPPPPPDEPPEVSAAMDPATDALAPAEDGADDEPAPVEAAVEDPDRAPAKRETADGPDAWARVDELGAEQEGDPDADSVEARWPDPELGWTDFIEAATLPDRARCARCEDAGSLRPCAWCGVHHCAACALEDERGAVTCAGCSAELDAPPPPEPPPQPPVEPPPS